MFARMKNVYSKRLDWTLGPTVLSEALARRRMSGAGLFDLTLSNPTKAGLHYDAGKILSALASPGALTYEPDPAGLPSARETIGAFEGVSPDRILLTASTSEAYAYLFKLLCDPGDEVLVPQPSYPLFEHLASLESVRTVPYPLFHDHGWHIDRHVLEARITARTRALILVNPNNPTGSYVSPEDLRWLNDLGIPLISDEVFFFYNFAHVETPPTGAIDFRLNGLSKLCGLPQLKLGWIVVNDPGALARLEWIADTYLSAGAPVQHAIPALLETGRDVREQIRARTQANLDRLEMVCRNTAVRLLKPEGGWSAVLEVPKTRSEQEWVLHLLDCGVSVQPGYFYDFDREAYLVVSLLVPESDFAAGLDILVQEIR